MTRVIEHPRKALGKGLSALFPDRSAPRAEATSEPEHGAVLSLHINEISPNPLQPRTVFEPERLAELAQSIRANGVIQPLIVRKKDDRYELVAGERRWRAAKLAGLEQVPVLVQDLADERLLEIALIENVQREDLNPVELAQAFDRMSREFHLSHEDIGQRTGKDRTTITNLLRLLRLPDEVQLLIAERRMSMGHAKAILGLPTPELQRDAADRVAAQGLSVRQIEHLVQRMSEPREPRSPDSVAEDPNVKAAVQELERALGTRVRIVARNEQRGRIEIEYYSPEDLDRIYHSILGEDER